MNRIKLQLPRIFERQCLIEKICSIFFTLPFQVLLNTSEVCIGTKKRQEVENDLLSCLALQVGLEPTTYGLTVRRSNQLSY